MREVLYTDYFLCSQSITRLLYIYINIRTGVYKYTKRQKERVEMIHIISYALRSGRFNLYFPGGCAERKRDRQAGERTVGGVGSGAKGKRPHKSFHKNS